jgi:CRISPR/Cas system-associated exonuclease Cas4 (RecB family)
MTLPTDFQFSQGNLQDYVDCPRRFQLRHLLRLAWPAVEAEPALENERHLQQGAAFHRLVHQHVLGLSPERLSSIVTDKDLSRWWHNYLNSAPADLSESRYPEIILSAPVRGHRLVAKYDLIAVGPVLSAAEGPGQQTAILDWKTSRKRPRRKWLAERLQTKVYPYLLVQAGSHLNEGRPFQPEQVEMVYWFADFPEDPERFPYDAAQYDEDGDYLASLIEEIKNLGDDGFPPTTQEQRCRYCLYRSLCQRGVRAGPFDEAGSEPEEGDDFGISLDFEQIAEIKY